MKVSTSQAQNADDDKKRNRKMHENPESFEEKEIEYEMCQKEVARGSSGREFR